MRERIVCSMIDAHLDKAPQSAGADSATAHREAVTQSRVIVALFIAYVVIGAGLSYIRGGSS